MKYLLLYVLATVYADPCDRPPYEPGYLLDVARSRCAFIADYRECVIDRERARIERIRKRYADEIDVGLIQIPYDRIALKVYEIQQMEQMCLNKICWGGSGERLKMYKAMMLEDCK